MFLLEHPKLLHIYKDLVCDGLLLTPVIGYIIFADAFSQKYKVPACKDPLSIYLWQVSLRHLLRSLACYLVARSRCETASNANNCGKASHIVHLFLRVGCI